MLRVVLATLFVAAIVAVGAILMRGAARYFEAAGSPSRATSGGNMQRVAFFLLLALMVYAILSGSA